MDKKVKLSLSIKSALVVVITQIMIYLLNLIQINCEFSSTDYNKLISWLIVISVTTVAVLIFKPKLRYFMLVPLVWIILMFFFFKEGYYLSVSIYRLSSSVGLDSDVYVHIKQGVAIIQITVLEFLIAAIITGIRKLVLYLNKFKKDKEEGQKELKNKFVSAVKFSLIIIATQIVMYFLNFLQTLCSISYVCNSLISITIVVTLTVTAVLLYEVKLRYFLLVPFVWAALFYVLPVSGIYLMSYVDTSFIYEYFVWTVTREIIAITLLQFLTASITVGARKLVLCIRNKPTEQIEEKQE